MAQRLADLASSGAVAAHHLSKRYGSLVAVDDVSFEVEVGEIFGIVGPNGAGKTTIVECLQGLRRPDGGDLSVLGLDPHGEPRALRRRVGSQLLRVSPAGPDQSLGGPRFVRRRGRRRDRARGPAA